MAMTLLRGALVEWWNVLKVFKTILRPVHVNNSTPLISAKMDM